MEHFSARLNRNFAPGDWLRASEALEVLSANSGRRIADSHLARLIERSIVRSEFRDGSKRRSYLYDDLAGLVVPRPGHEPDESNMKSNVRAQRAWRARQKALKERGGSDQAQAC